MIKIGIFFVFFWLYLSTLNGQSLAFRSKPQKEKVNVVKQNAILKNFTSRKYSADMRIMICHKDKQRSNKLHCKVIKKPTRKYKSKPIIDLSRRKKVKRTKNKSPEKYKAQGEIAFFLFIS